MPGCFRLASLSCQSGRHAANQNVELPPKKATKKHGIFKSYHAYDAYLCALFRGVSLEPLYKPDPESGGESNRA